MDHSFLGAPELSSEYDYLLGGKAKNLHHLRRAGFLVPAGFILFNDSDVQPSWIEAIGGFPVAVRSSGAMEDLENASFAGLYETYLFINSFTELKEAISKCFASSKGQRVRDYLDTKGIAWSEESLRMSVLVQKMVDAKIAGVLFTMNPFNGFQEEMYLEFCSGVGERLVSGHVTPTQVTYNWIEGKAVKVSVNSESTTIPESHLRELINTAAKIQAHYGKPQDIEWAIDERGQIHILQSRPITVWEVRQDTPELTNADFKDGGVSARICTPMMFSLYREALEDSMGTYFKNIKLIPNDEGIKWIHFYYGRVYWNAEAVKTGLKQIPGYDEAAFDRDLGIQKDYGVQGPSKTSLSLGNLVNAIPILIGLHREFLDCQNMIRLFRINFEEQDQRLKEKLAQLGKMSGDDFSKWMIEVINLQNTTEKSYFRTIYNNSNYQSEYKNYLKKLKGYQDGDEIDLMGELHGVSHLDVQSGLRILKKSADFYGFDSRKYYSDREDFLRLHYHHGPAELDITVERWGERKDWVDDLVKSFQDVSSPNESKFQHTYQRLMKSAGIFGRGSFESKTTQSREFLRLREEMRSYSTRAYYLMRICLLELAKRNGFSSTDIFFFDIREIRHFLQKGMSLPDVCQRKLSYQGYRHFKAPNEFGGTIKQASGASPEGILRGLGCSPGEFIGTARVITDIHLTGGLTKDDILVTTFTDPGWTPVLARVGGVITEVGGLLSHAAVIGREYRIPAILNLIDATKHIKDGDRIRVNGKTGTVEVLEKSS